MLFNSWQFIIFLIVTFTIYFVLPKKIRHIFLLVASYFFYAFWNFKLIFLILFTTLISYFGGLLIEKTRGKKVSIFVLVTSITLCLLCLIFFKYFDFLASSFVSLINVFKENKVDYIPLSIILPVGISFYTFQTLSYVIDVYRGKIESEKNIFYYALYVSFFPQLVAGPIERSSNLIPQFKNKEGIKIENVSIGLKYMLFGFVEKVVVADILGLFVTKIFNNISNSNGLLVLIGGLLFSIQILCDFNGYSSIAIGVAKMFNIDLMKNFDKPYKSKSISEFWRKWHISFSSWLKDYIYIPLGGSRVSYFRWALNILVVFLISGLWHGAAYTFIIWGLIHGIYIIVGRLTLKGRDVICTKFKVNDRTKDIVRMIFTYLLVVFAWIAFRANSISDMLIAYKDLFTSWGLNGVYFSQVSSTLELSLINAILIILPIIIHIFVEKLVFREYKHKIISYIVYVVLIWLVVGVYIYLSYLGENSQFIYFQF